VVHHRIRARRCSADGIAEGKSGQLQEAEELNSRTFPLRFYMSCVTVRVEAQGGL